RPQVMVTVSYKDLLNSIETTAAQGPRYNPNHTNTRPRPALTHDTPQPTTNTRPSPAPTNDTWQATTNHPTTPPGWQASGPQLLPGTWQISDPEPPAATTPDSRQTSSPEARFFGSPPDPPTGSGTFTYTGPVTASTIRKIACDADTIPILLGSQGRILDIGRTTRIFPPHIRKALTARDQGCAFPNCTIPASWCEAHHITYWSQGGHTSTDNGVLLCTAHHHLIHKEQWKIHIKNGVPWFIPPPHIDPRQQPRQNHHHQT
ncbi:MAG TPA: HNH endonuclease, partial [Arthrobacter sp.]|nr:HNH endonuclease [Arthrobacter sp.]